MELQVRKAVVLDNETSAIIWNDDSITVTNLYEGSVNLSKEKVLKFNKIWEELLEEQGV